MKLNRLRQLTLFEFRSMLRNRLAFFFTLVMPLCFFIAFGITVGRDPKALTFAMPALLTQMLLTGGIVTVAAGLASQRQTGSLRHLFSTPLPVGVWLFTRILATLLLTVVQTLLLFLVGVGLMKVTVHTNIPGLALVILVAALCMLSIGLLVGLFVRSHDTAMPAGMILYILLAYLGGAMMPIDNITGPVQAISRVMPSRMMNDAFNQTMMLGHGVSHVWGQLAPLAGIAVLALGVAIWRLRKQFVMI